MNEHLTDWNCQIQIKGTIKYGVHIKQKVCLEWIWLMYDACIKLRLIVLYQFHDALHNGGCVMKVSGKDV